MPTSLYGVVDSLQICGSSCAGVGHFALTLWMQACEVTKLELAQNCRYVCACLCLCSSWNRRASEPPRQTRRSLAETIAPLTADSWQCLQSLSGLAGFAAARAYENARARARGDAGGECGGPCPVCTTAL